MKEKGMFSWHWNSAYYDFSQSQVSVALWPSGLLEAETEDSYDGNWKAAFALAPASLQKLKAHLEKSQPLLEALDPGNAAICMVMDGEVYALSILGRSYKCPLIGSYRKHPDRPDPDARNAEEQQAAVHYYRTLMSVLEGVWQILEEAGYRLSLHYFDTDNPPLQQSWQKGTDCFYE